MATRKRQRVSWQLLGIAAVLAVFAVMGIVWILDGGSSGGPAAPDARSLGSDVSEAQQGVMEDGRPFMGDPDAPVTVYEFADFQCPHCRDFSRVFSKGFKQEYVATGKVKLVWVNFAFLGDESNTAAAAALCAADQGEFWAMHDWIFENQTIRNNDGAYSRARLVSMADEIGMDTETFDACLTDPATAERISADRDFGTEAGVGSTPSFLIGDTLIEGGGQEQVTNLMTAVDEALAEDG